MHDEDETHILDSFGVFGVSVEYCFLFCFEFLEIPNLIMNIRIFSSVTAAKVTRPNRSVVIAVYK